MKLKLMLILLFTAALLLAQAALAKGPPQQVTISGEDLVEELVITGDEATLSALGTMMLEDYETLTSDAPEGLSGDGYLITRFYEESLNPRQEYIPFDEVRYYPDPEGGLGYLNYIGIINGSSEYDGQWFRAVPEGETILRGLIDAAANLVPETALEAAPETAAPPNLFDAFFDALTLLLTAQ